MLNMIMAVVYAGLAIFIWRHLRYKSDQHVPRARKAAGVASAILIGDAILGFMQLITFGWMFGIMCIGALFLMAAIGFDQVAMLRND